MRPVPKLTARRSLSTSATMSADGAVALFSRFHGGGLNPNSSIALGSVATCRRHLHSARFSSFR